MWHITPNGHKKKDGKSLHKEHSFNGCLRGYKIRLLVYFIIIHCFFV